MKDKQREFSCGKQMPWKKICHYSKLRFNMKHLSNPTVKFKYSLDEPLRQSPTLTFTLKNLKAHPGQEKISTYKITFLMLKYIAQIKVLHDSEKALDRNSLWAFQAHWYEYSRHGKHRTLYFHSVYCILQYALNDVRITSAIFQNCFGTRLARTIAKQIFYFKIYEI